MNKLILNIIILLLIISCKYASEEKTTYSKTDLNGFYELQGEGEIIEINDSIVTSYYSSSFNCFPNWKVSRDYFDNETPHIQLIDENTFTASEGYTIFTYKLLSEKPVQCKELREEQENSYEYNFETLWHTFHDQYAFFKERNIDWKALKEKYRAKFTEETDLFDFYIVLEDMIQEIKDEHSDIEIPEEFEERWYDLYKPKDTTNYFKLAKNKLLDNYVQQVQKYNGGQVSWGYINEEIAYIQFNGMDGLANYNPENASEYWEIANESDDYPKDLIDGTHYIAQKIVNEIKDTKQCIIDLRFNGGGFDVVGLAFMSHFIDQEYEVFSKTRRFGDRFVGKQTIDIKPSEKPYLKPVYLLTSPYTVSAAETTIIATMNFPNFQRVGSNTNGALSDVLVKELPNGWEYTLSNEVYESMDGIVYEATGIPADYPIEYTRDEYLLFKTLNSEFDTVDSAIEKVKELTQSNTADK